MKNSIFQKAYLKIIAEENRNTIISEGALGDIFSGIVQPLAGVVKSGVSLAKGDFKGAGQGIKDVITAPVKIVKGVCQAPVELVEKTVEMTKKLGDHPQAADKIKSASDKIPDDAAKKFQEEHKDQLKDVKDPAQVKQIMVVTGIAQQGTQAAVENKKDSDKKLDDKEVQQKLKAAVADLNDGKYTITL